MRTGPCACSVAAVISTLRSLCFLLLTGCTEVTVNLQDSCVNVYLEAELTVDDVEKMPLPKRVDPSVGIEPVARPPVVLEL